MNLRCALPACLFGSAALSAFGLGRPAQEKNAPPQCAAVAISFSLEEGDDFQQAINDLTFKMQPLGSSGWLFSLEDAKGHDFIYPVNPALRFNPSQMLGAGYSDTAKQSFSHGRELRFLLSGSDYDAFEPYVGYALWPYTAPDPDHAADRYFDELDKLRTGLLRMTIVRADISEQDEVRSAEFGVEFIAPKTFRFASSLGHRAVACPEKTLPINERLPARLPVADPEKYRNVRDAKDWKNPFLTITADGFELTFQGGRTFGPLSILARTVAGLPRPAWPYGRVLAAAENGIGTSDSFERSKRNRAEADKILRELGLRVEWWPCA